MDHSARGETSRVLAGLHDERERGVEEVNRLFEVAYGELRRLAAIAMRSEHADRMMRPGDLVNETYLRLAGDTHVHWRGRAQFLGLAASAMREILVEHARRRAAAKRGGGWRRITLDDQISTRGGSVLEILDLDQSLLRLRAKSARMERVVELRVFGGMEVKEVAHVLGVSERTVHSDWRIAKIWFRRELSGGKSAHPSVP